MRTKKEMIEYLAGHFRYSTMNSWNGSTSYAARVKVNSRAELRGLDNAYEMLDQEEAFYEVNALIDDFAARHNWTWQIGFNGRSGGYMVLYQGERKISEYKSRCRSCGQKNYKSVTAPDGGGTKCGCCGASGEHGRADAIIHDVNTWPGRGTDQGEDFADWEMYSLRERVKLVKDFDKTVTACVKAFADFCRNNKVVEREIMVSKKIRVTEEK